MASTTWIKLREIQAAYESGRPYWRPRYDEIELIQNENPYPTFNVSARSVIDAYTKRDTHLWQYLLACFPNYRRGAQGIGDCVSWGAELAATILWCKQAVQRRQLQRAKQVATEPIYGGSRVEARNKPGDGLRPVGGWQDGSYGAAAANFLRKWGVVFREDHSATTDNPAHDYRVYDAKKAKDHGAYGCGGKGDRGRVDEIAKAWPLVTMSQANSFDDVAAAIAGAQCPVTIASMYGASMRRNKYGECVWSKSWAHQMCLVAVRFGRRPGALCAQSWGPRSAGGPSGDEYTDNLPPGGTPENILGFCWWIPADVIDRICRSGDCWAYGDYHGWKIDRFDWQSKMWGSL